MMPSAPGRTIRCLAAARPRRRWFPLMLLLVASCASGRGAEPGLRVDGGKLAARLALLHRLREEPEEAKALRMPASDVGLGGAAGGPGEPAGSATACLSANRSPL